jgi:hypothetical protein
MKLTLMTINLHYGMYPSDHFPVYAEVEVPDEREKT